MPIEGKTFIASSPAGLTRGSIRMDARVKPGHDGVLVAGVRAC
jgi:hypothetical protein